MTRKIAPAAVRISRGIERSLPLGTLGARRDWGYALDTVNGIRAITEASQPDDFVIATGFSHSVEDFCRLAFQRVGLDYREFVVTDPRFVRPIDISETRGDASKAFAEVGWAPTTGFEEPVALMGDAECHSGAVPTGQTS